MAPVKHAQPTYSQEPIFDDPPADPVDPPVVADPVDPVDPPTDDIDPEIRERVLASLRDGVPETPEGYTLPELDGFDRESAEGSATIKAMREAAHKAGLKPEAFNEAVKTYVEAETAEAAKFHEEQMALLGKDEAQRGQRISAINSQLTAALPKEQAEALMGAAMSADVVLAIETLLAKRPVTTTAEPPKPMDDWPTINKLMNSTEYMGYEHERDPAVVARVEAYFARGGKRGG